MEYRSQEDKDCEFYFNLYRKMERENRELRGRVAALEKESAEYLALWQDLQSRESQDK